jgi:DNA-binding CsgD family transcriptional regulator
MRRISSSVLVGRDAEVAELTARLDGAGSGMPSLTLIGGEAGVGKTRLLREMERHARRTGGLVLWGECVPVAGGELPYAPLIGALRDLAWGPEAERLEALPTALRQELALLVPELGGADAGPGPAISRYSQARLYERLLSLLQHLGTDDPVTLVIEDLHWADASSRDFLAFTVRNLRRERMAALLTYRTDEVEPGHPLRPLIADLIRRRHVAELRLERLSRAEIERQIEDILGQLPEPQVLDDVYRRSGGNPFLAEEVLDAGGGAAETLDDALRIRVDELPAHAQAVVHAIAVAGRPVGEDVLAAVVGGAELAPALREAIARHVIVVDRKQGLYAFRHALVREAVYNALLPGECRDIHRRLAQAIEDAGGDPGEAAYHWYAAGEEHAALPAAVRAGVAAVGMSAFDNALLHFERALELWDRVDPAAADVPLGRLDVLERAALAARLLGRDQRARELCADALGRIDAEADPVRAATFHEHDGAACFWDDEAALEAYAKALALLPEECVAQRARVLGAEGHVAMLMLRFEQSRERCELALELAERAGAVAEGGRARTTLGVALAFLGDTDTAIEHLEAALEIVERCGEPDDVAHAYLALAETERIRGAFDAALAVMQEGADTCERLGLRDSFGRFMCANAAEDLFRLGRWDECERMLRSLERVSLRRASEVLHHTVTAQLAVGRGAFDRAQQYIERAQALCEGGEVAPEYLPGVYDAIAELALWRGRPHDARLAVAAGLERIEGREDPLNTPMLYSLGALADAEIAEHTRARGREDELAACRVAATDRIRRLRDLIDRHALRRPPAEALSHLALCHAEHSRVWGDPSPDLWEAAVAGWESVGNRYLAAYARWRLAEAVLTAGGDRSQATTALRDAHVIAHELRASPLAAGVTTLARAARIDLEPGAPAQAEPAPEAPAGLTDREIEVLRLLADGLTNREIAERLFISEKTAGVHVSNILGKVGARNRVMAAGAAHRLGLVRHRGD